MLLITGFGPFLDVVDNPSARLARAVDGAMVDGEPVVGRVLPVAYARGPERAIALAHELRPRLVLGLGVARSPGPRVERIGRRGCGGTPDIDGATPADNGPGPIQRHTTLPAPHLAAALGGRLSDDAGSYVCNAWLYRVLGALPELPVGFVHIGPEGLPPQRLLRGLAAVLEALDR